MSFIKLGLSNEIMRAVTELGYTEPTAIQQQAIPAILAGGDLLAAAQTGSGKTAAFTLPILHLLADKSVKGPSEGRPPIRALILVPTRELAQQIEESIIDYGKYLSLTSMIMIGGVSINPQIKLLRSRVDILVATPGRLLDHIGQGTLDLSQIKILVLDEADRMLDMGFIRDIRKILALLPGKRQNLLFSATFSQEIKILANDLLNDPALIEASAPNTTVPLITHKIHPVSTPQKRMLLAYLIKEHNWYQVLVFTRTKHGANRLADFLTEQGLPALAIHGNKSQSNRTRTLAQFKDGSLQVLVATDIAARGLDIVDLPHVVNYELPNIPEDYVHRIGRTGRAGKKGDAVSLVAPDEKKYQQAIERLLKMKIDVEVVSGFSSDDNFSGKMPDITRPNQSRQTPDFNPKERQRSVERKSQQDSSQITNRSSFVNPTGLNRDKRQITAETKDTINVTKSNPPKKDHDHHGRTTIKKSPAALFSAPSKRNVKR